MPRQDQPVPKPRRAFIYCRVSLDRNGVRQGVETQERECREWAAEHGWEIAEVYAADNDISAHSGKHRPDWERLLADITAGKTDGLLGQHLDRLLRRMTDLERLLNALDASPTPVQVAFKRSGDIDLTNSSGRMLARILATVAQNESELKAERVRSARRREALAGEAHTHLGYGYNTDRTINVAERDIILEVRDRLLHSNHTLLAIATDFNRRGLPTPAAGKWTSRHVDRAERLTTTGEPTRTLIARLRQEGSVPTGEASRLFNAAGGRQPSGEKWRSAAVRDTDVLESLLSEDLRDSTRIARVLIAAGVPTERMYWRAANLRTMIRRGSLCGWREFSPGLRGGHGEMVAKGDWTPILTKDEIEAIRRITDKHAPVKGGRAPKFLLTGIARCGRCGSKMGGHTDKRTGVSRYQCSQQAGLPERCGKTSIISDPVDAMVTEAVLDLIADQNFRARTRTRRVVTNEAVAQAEAELDRLREDLHGFTVDMAGGRLTRQEYLIISDGLKVRIREAERVLGADTAPVREALKDIPAERVLIDEWWEALSLNGKREVIKTLINSVPVLPVTTRSNRFDPSRVGEPDWRV